MSACEAARQHTTVPKGAIEAMPCGEGSCTFLRLVAMDEEENGHASIVAGKPSRFIGVAP
jgi:hypothetical protein